MLLSMTGFGSATVELPNKKITVEVKSLNSKQFDLSARVPSTYRIYELEWRNIAASKLERGKVDLTVTVENRGDAAAAHLNVDAMQAYKHQISEVSQALGIPEPSDWYSVLMRFPDVMSSESDTDISDAENAALTTTLNTALDNLMAYRRAEGEKLEVFFAARIKAIGELLNEVSQYEYERIEHIKNRLADGLSKISVLDYDKGRLEQEMIFYLEKLDVKEEKQRLTQHLAYFTETMNLPTPGQGKKLGFIAQEMGREINTLGSKSNHAEMQKIVVRMKDKLEQIKEQVLNVM
jgi:uncharacterized protein (TIGR00255 family)